MKFPIIVLSILSLLILSCSKQDKSESSISLDSPNGLYNPKEMDQFLEKSKLSKAQRIKSIKNLQEAFKQKYIGYTLKEKLIGKHPDKIFSDCIDRESKTVEYASYFEFYDNILICLAEFKDSHLYIKNMLATVTTFIATTNFVDNKLVISSLREDLIKKMDELRSKELPPIAGKLNVGDEIISIDGKPSIEVIKDLEKYISSSSEDSARDETASKVFRRNFKYPQKKSVSVKIKNKESKIIEVSLPWFIDGRQSTSLDSMIYLKKIGIPFSKDLNIEDSDMEVSGFLIEKQVFENTQNFKFPK